VSLVEVPRIVRLLGVRLEEILAGLWVSEMNEEYSGKDPNGVSRYLATRATALLEAGMTSESRLEHGTRGSSRGRGTAVEEQLDYHRARVGIGE